MMEQLWQIILGMTVMRPQANLRWQVKYFPRLVRFCLKFIYSKKATKCCEISIVDLIVTTYIGQIYGEDFAKICGLLRISKVLKFIYSKKATKFCESKVEISQNSVAFSEYMNFIKCCFCSGIRVGYANHFRPIISQRIFRFSPHISRFFCFASKIGNPLIFASTIFRYLARDTILQDPSSLHLLWKMF